MSNVRPLAVCIVSFERSRLTERCIRSVRETTAIPHSIYVVDNGSALSETRAFLTALETESSVRLIRLDSNHGPAHARNRMLESVDGQPIAYAMLDNDMVALEGWAEAALAAVERGVDMVQPKLLQPDLETVERGPTVARSREYLANPEYLCVGMPRHAPEVARRVPVPVVGAGVYSARLFETVGLYDERFFVAEDFDLSFRARAAGLGLEYEPRCELVHDHQFDIGYDEERSNLARILESNVAMLEKHGKVLLSPEYLFWYRWLLEHGEPVYMARDQKGPRVLLRRLRRRATREWCRLAHGKSWRSLEEARGITLGRAFT